jgi:hypothetical protein
VNTPTRVNGYYPSFVSIGVSIGGYDAGADLTAISYKDNVDRGEVRGAARQVLGRTRGDYKCEGSIEMLLAAYKAMRARLGNRFYDEVFTITVNVAEDDTAPITTDELIRCRFKGRDHDHKQGTEGLSIKIDLDIDGLVEDQQLPYEGFLR